MRERMRRLVTVQKRCCRRKRRLGIFVTVLCMMAVLYGFMVAQRLPAMGEETSPRVIRVAFPEVRGITETDENGVRSGLVVDYLNEIAKYTGWEYEYVDTDGDTAVNEFLNGEYEILGGTYYTPGFEKYFAYADYDMGKSKSVLLARMDDHTVRGADLRSLNGKTIGVYERAAENIRRLKEYLSINGLECEIKTYSFEEISAAGNLYPYLESGEVDLLLGNGFENASSFRVVASFDSQPYYLVTNVGNQEVLDGLNMALEKITDSNPNFAEDHYNANFSRLAAVDIQLSEEELSYIREKKEVTVAVPSSYHPLFCMKGGKELHRGLVPDILSEVTEFSGLEFSFVYADSYGDAVRMVQQGEVDMLSFFQGSEEASAERGLALTAPYVTLNSIVVRNKASSYPDDGLIAATVEGQGLPTDIQASEVRIYSNIKEALSAVNRGEADFVYGLAASLERNIQQNHFANLVPVTLINDRSDLSFALSRPVDVNLFTVMDKSINKITAAEKAVILDKNLVSIGTDSFSIKELIYGNPVEFICLLAFLLVVLVAVILWVNRVRTHAAIMQSNLEKAEAESRAKGEFLSNMSHEIRTPMNAVVGLADLTSMMENVPEEVQQNLDKIRSSSRYLLELINDILDMSRISNGRLSIASEPFSMEYLLGEIDRMMEGEALRRGLVYMMEKDIVHEGLTGDAIRLRQVVTNLLSNAFKFTPAGGTVLLRVREADSSETGASYSFQVIDSGIGISAEDQQRIFRSFEQVGTNSAKSQGTGLGLAISRSIVQMMGGELQVKSEPGCGSEFYFDVTLPYGQPVEILADGTKELANQEMLAGIHILMAEDNDLNAEIAVELLQIQGASVHRSIDGRQVLADFEKSRPGEYQVILMDIQMPEMNGLDAARAIRALPRPDAAVIPIVAMTANSFKEDVEAAMEAGMNGFVSKPLDVNYFYSLLLGILKDDGKYSQAEK